MMSMMDRGYVSIVGTCGVLRQKAHAGARCKRRKVQGDKKRPNLMKWNELIKLKQEGSVGLGCLIQNSWLLLAK